MVRVSLNDVKRAFHVYPNPVQNSRMTVELSNLEKGQYTVALYNAAGQKVAGKTLVHNGGTGVETWDLHKMSPGIYQLQLRSESFTGQQTIIIKE